MRRWFGETAGGLPRDFWFLWANTLINRLGSFVLVVLTLYLTVERGLSESFAGLVLGLWGAGAAAGTLLGGVLADRVGRKPTFVAAMFASAFFMLVMGFLQSPVELAIGTLLLGLTAESARPAMQAMVADIVPEKDRMRAFSLFYWAINVGFAFAALMGGFLADVDFRLLFILDAATTVAAATLVLVKVAEPVRRTQPPQDAARPEGLGTVFRDRVFIGFVGTNVLFAMMFMQHIAALPLTMSRDGLPASTFGSVIALNGILIVAGQFFLTRFVGRLRSSTALAIAAVISGIGLGLTAFADTPAFYAVTVLIWTLGEMVNAPAASTTGAALAPAHLRGRYQGVFSFSWSVAGTLAPIIGTAVLQHLGVAPLWIGCLVVGLIVAGIHIVAGPARERRTGEMREDLSPLARPETQAA